MPPSSAYATDRTVDLTAGEIETLAPQFGTDHAVQIIVSGGSVRLSAKADRGIQPTSCSNRCRVQLLSDSLNANELSGLTLAGGQGNAAIHAKGQSANQPVKVDAELTAGEFVEYSGGLDVTITGSSASTASISIKTSETELPDPR